MNWANIWTNFFACDKKNSWVKIEVRDEEWRSQQCEKCDFSEKFQQLKISQLKCYYSFSAKNANIESLWTRVCAKKSLSESNKNLKLVQASEWSEEGDEVESKSSLR